ncbi:hypothetical protein Q0601_05570 [Paracoccus onubensis]|nr:hypothetical protein [Paracoccus onubensis]
MAGLVDGVNGFIVIASLMTFRDKEKLLLDSGLLSRLSAATRKSALRVVSGRMRGQPNPALSLERQLAMFSRCLS